MEIFAFQETSVKIFFQSRETHCLCVMFLSHLLEESRANKSFFHGLENNDSKMPLVM